MPIDPIARLVLDSGGHLLTRDLPQRGVPHHHVLRDARAGRLERVDRGVYLVRDRDREPRARYADRVRAVRAAHPGWAASHHSALELQGLPRLSADHSTVHLLGPAGRSRRRPGLHLHRDPGADVVDDGTGAVVGPAVACVQVAALDGVDAGLVAMDAALARGLVEHADLEHSLAWVRYGVGAARRALELAHGRSESPGESLLRLRCIELGRVPVPQVELRDASGHLVARVDLVVDDVVLEFDGAVKYEGADGREELVREKAREDAIRALGYRVIRVTWRDLFRPGWLGPRLSPVS